MNRSIRLITIVLIFIIVISGLSSVYLFQTNNHRASRDQMITAANVSSQPIILPLKYTQIRFTLININSNKTPSGKIYIDKKLAINITESNLSNLRFRVAENRFYRFQINFNNNAYLPYYLNTTIEGNTSVPVILQSMKDGSLNVYVPRLELDDQYISLIIAFLILMLSLVAIPRKYQGKN